MKLINDEQNMGLFNSVSDGRVVGSNKSERFLNGFGEKLYYLT